MPDSSIPINAPTTVGQSMASFLDASGDEHEKTIAEFIDGTGQPVKVSATDPLPVTDTAAEAALASIAAEDFATQAKQNDIITALALLLTITDFDTKTGSLTETAPATDTASSGLNGRLQRIAQRLTSLIALLPTVLGVSGGLKIDGSGTALPISGTVTVTGAGDASASNQTLQIIQETAINTVLGLIADAAVAAGATGSISAKLRAISRDLVANIVLAAGTNAIGKLAANSGVIIGAVEIAAAQTLAAVTAITNALPAGNNNIGDVDVATLPALVAGTALIGKVGIDQTTDGTTNKVRATATQKPSIGATVVLAVTALQSLASSATVGWGSVRVSNLATLATDYEIMVKLTTANTAPANDKCMYVFAVPWYTSDAGSTWFASSQGTTTLPSGTDAASTIASPHNLRLLGVLNYTTQQMVVQDTFLLSNCFGNRLPDGFSIIIVNFSGAALSTGCIVDYSPLNDILV